MNYQMNIIPKIMQSNNIIDSCKIIAGLDVLEESEESEEEPELSGGVSVPVEQLLQQTSN